MSDSTQPQFLLTIDLEDWYQTFGDLFGGSSDVRPDVMERQLDRIMDLLDRHRLRATFFVLGKSFEKHPHFVKRVADAGHEIATHGWGHEPLPKIGLEGFRKDLRRSMNWLTDLTGRPVLGYRAPIFSVREQELELFYDICFEEGLRYDSSVFPFPGRRYGIPSASREPRVVRNSAGRRLVEMPLATVNWAGRRWPVAGGVQWRLLPRVALSGAFRRLAAEGVPGTTYFHPYEFDPRWLNFAQAAGWSFGSVKRWFFQSVLRFTLYRKVDRLAGQFRFGAVEDYLRGAGLL